MTLTPEERKFIREKIIERLHSKLVARELMPVRRSLDTGWLKDNPYPALMRLITAFPVIYKTYSFNSSTEFDSNRLYKTVDMISEEEDKILLTGEYAGFSALGIEGLLRSAGCSIASSGPWPQYVFNDVVQAKTILRKQGFKDDPVLILPNTIYSSLEKIAWEPPNDYIKAIEPKTYLNLLLDQKIIRAIYPTDCLFAVDGGMDSALLYQPNQENYILSPQVPRIDIQEKEDRTFISIFEAITPIIRNPSTIVELTNIVV